MTVPTLILQAVFVIATGACFLLIGAALGATILPTLEAMDWRRSARS